MGFSPSVPVVAKITSNLFIDGLKPILQVIKAWYDRICGVNPKSEI